MLARSHELTAIRAGGVNAWRVAVPFILASLATAAASFAAHDALLPYSNQEANLLRDQIRNRSPRSYRRPDRRWVFGSSGLLFNFSHFNPDKQEFQDLSIFRFAPGSINITERTFAHHAAWTNGAWTLDDGWSRTFDGDNETYEAFATRAASDIDPPDYFVQDWKAPDQMDFRELRLHVNDLEQRGYDTRELRVGLYRKISVPCVAVVMLMMALPFCLRVEQRGPGFALGASVLLVFIYYAAMQAFGKLGEVALLPPLMAAWGPNLIFAGAGAYWSFSSRW
jgi:LPS export ABC transporter permease LptG